MEELRCQEATIIAQDLFIVIMEKKIGASKTQCSAEGNSLQLQPHINIKVYSNKHLYIGLKTGVMIGAPFTGYFVSSNIIF
jgi:hypothetical protein